MTRSGRRSVALLLVGAAAVIVAAVLVTARSPTSNHLVTAIPSPTPTARPTAPPRAVAWAPLPPAHQSAAPVFVSSNPPLAVPKGTPPCRSRQVEAVTQSPVAAAGNEAVPVLIRNSSTVACELDGYPDIQVIGTSGQVLARATGTAAATVDVFFEAGPPMAVLLAPRTPSLQPSATAQEQQFLGTPGQALVNVSWYDCHQPKAATLTVDLPGAGGRLRVPFDVRGDASPACVPPILIPASLSRGSFSPIGADPPAQVAINVTTTIAVDTAARPGSVLVYYVTLDNLDAATYTFDPCPDYTESLASGQSATTNLFAISFQLNCVAAAALPAGRSVTFEMRLTLPASTPIGPAQLSWALEDARLVQPSTAQSILVEASDPNYSRSDLEYRTSVTSAPPMFSAALPPSLRKPSAS